MTTEESINALLPDNNTGAISAADVRAAFALILADIAAEADEREAGDAALAEAIEAVSGTAATISVQGTWQYAGVTMTPEWGQFGSDSDTLADATMVYFSAHKSDGVDIGSVIAQMSAGDQVFGVSTTDPETKGRFDVTGDAVLDDGVVAIPVTPVSLGGDGLLGWEQVSVIFIETI